MVVDAGIRQDDGEEVTVHPSVTAALPEIAARCERLGVPVDVVVAASIRNPYFLRQLRSEAEPLYAA